MNKFAKLVEGKLVWCPDAVDKNGVHYRGSAYTDEMKKADGYKLFVDSERPEYKEGFEIHEVLTEKADTIERTWEYREVPIPQPSEFDEVKSIIDFNIMTGKLDNPSEV